MQRRRFTSAVIPAGGCGSRMKSSENKLLMKICEKTVIERTLEAFAEAKTVDEIVLAVPSEKEDIFRKIAEETVKNKPVKIVSGGLCREESVRNGLYAADKRAEFISVHDAARPLITPEEIDGINLLSHTLGAVCAGSAVKNTVKTVGKDGKIIKTLDRSSLFSAETPQVFRKDIIETAFEKNAEKLSEFTDDASLAESCGYEVYAYYTSEKNIKITTPDDIKTAEKLLEI